MQILRTWRPGKWEPDATLEGGENVAKALGSGRGVILWVAHFSYNSLATKIALHRAGFNVVHMSRAEHGFSKTQFGKRFLNQLRVRPELRYLRARILIDPLFPNKAVLAARRVLDENGILSITAGHWEGARIALCQIGGHTYPVATGAPALAMITGAALLPVITLRQAESGRIVVRVAEAIDIGGGADRLTALRAAIGEYVDLVFDQARLHPEQWRGWDSLMPA